MRGTHNYLSQLFIRGDLFVLITLYDLYPGWDINKSISPHWCWDMVLINKIFYSFVLFCINIFSLFAPGTWVRSPRSDISIIIFFVLTQYIELKTRHIDFKSQYIEFTTEYIEFKTRYIDFESQYIEFTTQYIEL